MARQTPRVRPCRRVAVISKGDVFKVRVYDCSISFEHVGIIDHVAAHQREHGFHLAHLVD
jgi:hypothetical protein